MRIVVPKCRITSEVSSRNTNPEPLVAALLRHNIGTLGMIVKLQSEFGVLNCSFAFESVSPAPDFFLALLEDIVHFFVAVVLVMMKQKQLFYIRLCSNPQTKQVVRMSPSDPIDIFFRSIRGVMNKNIRIAAKIDYAFVRVTFLRTESIFDG